MSEKIVSTNLDAVKCVIGQSTKKDNTVTMKVDSKVIIEAVELYDSIKKGLKPKTMVRHYQQILAQSCTARLSSNKLINADCRSDVFFLKARCTAGY